MEFRPHTESGIKPDIILPNGRRLRSLPYGGRQYRMMGIHRFRDGFEVVDLHPHTLEPFDATDNPRVFQFTRLHNAIAWADYETESMAAWLLDGPKPPEPAIRPLNERPEAAPIPKARNVRGKGTWTDGRITITIS